MSQLFTSGGQSIGVSASASVLSRNSGLISFRMDWLDLLAGDRVLCAKEVPDWILDQEKDIRAKTQILSQQLGFNNYALVT